MNRPIALVTGASRRIGIGAAIARALAKTGWDIALSYWRPYDEEMPWGNRSDDVRELQKKLEKAGAAVFGTEADLSIPDDAVRMVTEISESFGSIDALILAHCYSVDRTIQSSNLEEFDRHFAVNTRATWLLIREFVRQFSGEFGQGRIIGITSDHVAGNMPYGASKGAMDRIILAAAEENRHLGITANVINPGATDTGWMDDETKAWIKAATFLNRLGKPEDCANLVGFLCSEKGGWINGQLLYSNGGVRY
jgi:3-oxoacyl-[acyl-carrier protein] reductase